MGLKVKRPERSEGSESVFDKVPKKNKVYFVTPIGVSSNYSQQDAERDADILIQAEAIKTDKQRYNSAKSILRTRGLL